MSFYRRFSCRPRTNQFRRFLIWFALGSIIVAILFEQSIRPVVATTVGHRVHNEITNLINNAAAEILSDEKTVYTHLNRNSQGEIVSIETDTTAVNRFQTKLTEKILSHLKRTPELSTQISFGTLSGIQFFSGYGPQIAVKVLPVGNVKVISESRLNDVGINQTLHQIIVIVHMRTAAILPGFTTETDIDVEYILSETMIVGTVPNIYAEMQEN